MNIALDNTGDLDFSTGNLRMITNSEEISQKLKTRYRFFLGEWFLDARLGVPWIQTIFVKGTSDAVVRSKLMKVAVTCPGVSTVSEWTMVRDNAVRSITISFRAHLTTGEDPLDFSEEFII